MYYRIKKNKREELQEGRTLQYLANKCNYSRQYITDAFNAKVDITRECAINIMKGISNDSIKISSRIKKDGINKTIEYFFEKIK